MFRTFVFVWILSQIHDANSRPFVNKYQHYLELHSVDIFRRYLRIDTSKEENIQNAVNFLIRQLSQLGIPYKVCKPAGLPILIATIRGSDPKLPSIMLNSHMDVVTVAPDEWKYPPFDAHMDHNGDIYARGTQDTKDVGIQYLEAIRRLKKDNVTLTRTLHITFMPDEELGGFRGMKPFSRSREFQSMNVGFVLDEGLASSDDDILGLYVDRRPWQMQFTVHGEGGHGLKISADSAMERMQKFINALMAYRKTQLEIAVSRNNTDFSYTSLNINILSGGLGTNIIPTKLSAVVDMRLSPDADVVEMDSIVQSWKDAAGNMTDIVYFRKDVVSRATAVDDSNPYWVAMKTTLNNMGKKIIPIICPATSDVLVLRNLGIPAIGFSPKVKTLQRAHDNNEYQNVETFINGIDIYIAVIKSLANVPG